MTFVRTYFQNRIDQAELSRLLLEGASFHLENVENVDQTAMHIAQMLHQLGRTVRVSETRISFGRDVAMSMLPWTFGIFIAAQLLYQGVAAWMRHPRPDVVVIKRNGAVEVRRKDRPAGSS